MAADGLLRARGGRWCCTRRGSAVRTGLRGTGDHPVRIVEQSTGRLVGTVDEPSAHVLAHTGAVYLIDPQGRLLVTLADGSERALDAGDVHLTASG